MAKLLFLVVVLAAGWYWLRPRRKRIVPIDDGEARAILGVAPDAGADAIRAAHRRLIAAVHPDRGGSAELARRINLARDSLLANRD